MKSFSSRFKTLRFKLMGLSMSIVAIMGAAAFFNLQNLRREMEDSSTEKVSTTARNLSDAIAAQFYERYADIQAFAMNPNIKSNDRKVIVSTLNDLSALYSIYDLIMIVDARGKLVAVTDKSPAGQDIKVQGLYEQDFSNAPWFKAVMGGQFTEDKSKNFAGTFVENVQIDPWVSGVWGTKRLGTAFSAPVKDAQGKTIGVITNRAGVRWFDVAFREAHAVLRDLELPNAKLYLASKQGELLFEYSPKVEGTNIIEPAIDFDRVLRTNLLAVDEGFKRAVQETSGHLVSDTKEGPMVTGYDFVDGPKWVDSIGWQSIVRTSEAEANANATAEITKFYWSLGIIMTLVALASYLFSEYLARRLDALAQRLSAGSGEVASAASQIAGSSQQLSDAATEQAAAIQETAAAVDEVSSMIKKSADNAERSKGASQTSRGQAETGKHAVEEMIQSIQGIASSNADIVRQVEESNREISEIVKVIGEIGNKTKVINDIVFQTKLLSFNASVEAARAGEHGKGFAVVAEEVGNLAQMSGNAAKEISEMLDSSIKRVERIVDDSKSRIERLIGENRGKIEDGTKVAERCGESLQEILGTVQEVDSMVTEIAGASSEQAQGIIEINKAMNQLDNVTQQNTSVSQTAASSAMQLSQQAGELKHLVLELMAVVHGEAEIPEAAPAQPAETAARPAKSPGKILNFESASTRRKAAPAAKVASTPLKKAVGAPAPSGGGDIPSKDDPRFQDV